MRIREATPADATALTALYTELVGDSAIRVLPTRLGILATHPDHAVLIAEKHDMVLGTAHLLFCMDAMYAEQPYALVENVVVTEQARGQRIGAALFREIDRRCLARNCSKIMLLSSAARADAHRFFAQAGYQGDRKRGFVKYRRDIESDAAKFA